ncbi:Z1 domain-containing protein [Thalassospira marina]|uniref:Endonuclease n=1 Tax=Thalassospira marina TaxID=2048283 RepID=A0ABM6QF96_9PROT|nr:Z1 domain-containing protein [Thalassospira marina]AUG55279.1 endonuclease [Thalassospira marina]
MNGTNTDIEQKVIKFVQELLLDEGDKATITPVLIAKKIELVLKMNPRWGSGLNRDHVTDELIRRFSLWIGQDTLLANDAGHEAWLVASRKQEWRYWQRYREWLERKLSYKAVDGLDQSTDTVLGLLEDPLRKGRWDRRGLVVGHVQSGKTGHYTGLICKAADAGYKIVIVLAGLHNNLRSQTQMRLDEGFLGYETKPVQEDIQIIGVGEIDGDPSIRPNFATNRTNKGDFTTSVAKNLGISPEQRPWLFVVKKNKTVLERLLRWIRNHVADLHDQESGRRIVTNLPLLVIDDEADHASVDTGEQVFDLDGRPDDQHQPTTINRLIRRILFSFARSAYVGYTATPFANIFIHERGATREEGPDLFPSAFIVNLAAPSNYIGPVRIFGQNDEEWRNGGVDLIREIHDHSTEEGFGGWMPQKHKNGHIPLFNDEDAPPPSLIEAINAFLLACAVRRLRGQESEHASMLVHVTRFNSVQRHVHLQVEEQIRHLRQRLTRGIGHEQVLADMRSLWQRDFVPTSLGISGSYPDLVPEGVPTWEEVASQLADVVSDIQVRMINGTAKDALDYSEHEGAGLKVIAIGGDKLARGLTLEGLCVSYFLRASRMYDTLMQMGRWFGYRPGYLDLCRLYTTSELSEWFGHIADAAEELREEFDIMAATGATPREYGLKVQSHSVLMVTSRLKMRSAKNLMLSFSGQLLETVALYRTKGILEQNLATARRLVLSLGSPEVDPERTRNGSRQKWAGSFLWTDVSASDVIDFLTNYKTHPDAHKVNSLLLAEFIQSMSLECELTHWTVAVIGGGEGAPLALRDDIVIDTMKRKMKGTHEDRYSIGRLMSPRDEAIDLEEEAWKAALKMTQEAWRADPGRREDAVQPDIPNGPAIRKVRGFGATGIQAHPERGLLFLYGLDPLKAEAGFPEDTPPIVAFAISFPGSRSGTKVEYKVNNVLWEQEYGSAE